MVPFEQQQQQQQDRVDCCIGRTRLAAMIGDCPRTCLIVCFLHLRWLILSLSQRVAMCGWRGILRQSDKFLKIQAATVDRPHDLGPLAPLFDTTAAVANRAEGLLQCQDYQGAASAAVAALENAKPHLAPLTRTALVAGKALMAPAIAQFMDDEQTDKPGWDVFAEAWDMFVLALRLDPENEEAQEEFEKLQQLRQMMSATQHNHPEPPSPPPSPNHPEPLDVIVVGAGASGVGIGLMLTHTFGLDPQRVLLIERGTTVGETFRQWPREMRFISPSFNQQGWTKSFDLNSVAYGTSPAFTLHTEHPTGEQYADYLCALAEQAELNVQTYTEVTAVRPFGVPVAGGVCDVTDGEGFEVEVRVQGQETLPTVLRTRFVVSDPQSWRGYMFSHMMFDRCGQPVSSSTRE